MSKLTFETLKAAIDELESHRKESLEIIPHPILNGMQTVVRHCNKVYYPPDIQSGEIKVITLPEDKPDTPKLSIDYCSENFALEMSICKRSNEQYADRIYFEYTNIQELRFGTVPGRNMFRRYRRVGTFLV